MTYQGKQLIRDEDNDVAWVKLFSILTDFSFLAKVQKVLEIRVNFIMSFFREVRYALLTKKLKL
jgi:hypothetical protein